MKAEEFFALLFTDYVGITPQAARIFDLVQRRFGKVSNDHVAFRTFASGALDLERLEQPFLRWGYRRDGFYEFPNKHLRAFSYVPAEDTLPLVFISELVVEALSPAAQHFITSALAAAELASRSMAELLLGTRPWPLPTWQQYEMLHRESPYAAWLSVWGLRANHFTVAVHDLPMRPTLRELVADLKQAGYAMNEEGGLIQGTPADHLEQASTLAELRPVRFRDGSTREIASCYYEFAERHRLLDGTLYQGFVAQNANNIFESTTVKLIPHGPVSPDAHHS